MVWASKEEMHRYPNDDVREVGYGGSEERQMLAKEVLGEVIRLDMRIFSLPMT